MSLLPDPIRVLFLTWAEDHHVNAQQVNAREITRRLDPSRFRVTLLSEGGGPASIAASPHVELLRLPSRGRALRILSRLARGGFDLVGYPGPGLPEAIYLRLPRWAPGRRARVLLPVEGDVRQLDEAPAWIRRRVDRLHRRADVLFPVTDHVAGTLAARCGRTGEVVPVGVDLDAFHPREGPRATGPLRVLSVGTVKAWKRPELVRLAAERIPGARFTWIGDGELRASEAAAAPPNCSFPGPAGRDALPAHFRDADVLLHPSRMEGLPKVILEALASGLPVVAFDDYAPRFLVEGRAGFVVSTPEEMVAALGRLRDGEALRQDMGKAARTLAQRFSWDVVARRWAEIFEREAALARREPHD